MHRKALLPKCSQPSWPRRLFRLPSGSTGNAAGIAVGLLLVLGLLPTLSAKDTLAPTAGPRHHLVRDGRTLAMIVLPTQPDMLEGQAAAELQRYIREITGRTLPILNEPVQAEGFGAYNEPQKLDGYGIWLGKTQAAESAQFTLTEEKLGRDGYAAQADDKGLIVVGRCPLGTLFGVYDIIEREFGVRWFVPDEQQRILTPQREQIWVEQDPIGEVVPKANHLSVGTFRKEFKPSFEHRWVREGTWALHNRMNVWVSVNGQTVGVNYKWYGHTITALIPPHQYFAEHPEWFALVQGKRQGTTDPEGLGHDAQLCTSNPEVAEKLAQRLIETLEAEPTIEVISLSPNDGGGFCECENCTALDGPPRKPEPSERAAEKYTDSAGVLDGQPMQAARKRSEVVPWKYSNRFAILHNEVARRVARRFPNVKIKVFAYGYYVLPPDIPDFRVEPNLLVQVVGTGAIHGIPGTVGERTAAVIAQWRKLTNQLGIYKAYAVAAWGKAQVMRGVVHEIREDIPALRDQGVKMFFTQYMQQPWTQCPLNHYIAAKLVWNADLDVDWLIQDYCDKFFEKSAEPMHDYLMEIEQVTLRYDALGMEAYDSATRDRLRSLLEQAQELADSEVVRKRIAAIRTAFDACEQSVLRATKVSDAQVAPPLPAKSASTKVNAQSASGLNYYSQGGVVVGGIAYFTANDHCAQPGNIRTEDFPCVVAIDLKTLQVVKRYNVSFTYDSSPVVFLNRDGEWLVAAHEYKESRTVALKRDSGEVAWRSPPNQPGAYFFGYTHYLRDDGSRLLLMSAQNGLHAMDGDTGQDAWHVARGNTGGVTPAVDQADGWIFYQCSGNVLKIDTQNGAILKSVAVPSPSRCTAWNTVLTDDAHGAYVATYWIGPSDSNEWGSGIRVYDKDLNLIWEKTGLPAGKKATLTYADGKLVIGSGNQWGAHYEDNRWKYIAALAIEDGTEVWKCDLSHYDYTCILNVPYFHGSFYAETQDTPGTTSKVFKIQGRTGKLEEVLDFGRDISSCATSIIACGKLLSGDLVHDRLVVTQLANGASSDWPGPFGHPQLNHMAVTDDPSAQTVPMREIQESQYDHEN